MTIKTPFLLAAFLMAVAFSFAQKVQISDSDYFEKPGVNVFVFSGQYGPIFLKKRVVLRRRSAITKQAGTMGLNSCKYDQI